MRVLDVGCGTGATTRSIAARVAPGEVVGVDISALLLGLARDRSTSVANASFIEADAQTHAFDSGSFDAAFSRMGVMFFADPVAAFANIHGALRGGGCLAFVCWQSAADNEWVSLPAQAAREWIDVLAAFAVPSGPFGFADAARLASVLEDAGFSEVHLEDVRRPVLVGGRGDADTAMRFLESSRVGKLVADEASDPGAALAAIRDALLRRQTTDGVELTAAVWLVTARA